MHCKHFRVNKKKKVSHERGVGFVKLVCYTLEKYSLGTTPVGDRFGKNSLHSSVDAKNVETNDLYNKNSSKRSRDEFIILKCII